MANGRPNTKTRSEFSTKTKALGMSRQNSDIADAGISLLVNAKFHAIAGIRSNPQLRAYRLKLVGVFKFDCMV